MQVKIFTLAFNEAFGGFDDTEVRAFLADKRSLSIHDHAFVHRGLPHMSLVVTYEGDSGESSVPNGKNRAKRDDSWRELLTAETMPYQLPAGLF